jgi:hypothetical protein
MHPSSQSQSYHHENLRSHIVMWLRYNSGFYVYGICIHSNSFVPCHNHQLIYKCIMITQMSLLSPILYKSLLLVVAT